MLKVKGLSLQRELPITFLHKFLPVVTAFFQDSTFAYLALFPPGQSRPRRMYGNLLVLCLFYSCPPRFRAWTGVTSEKVGSWQTDTGRALTGKIDLDICSYVWESSGVLSGLGASDGINPQQGAMNGQQTAFDFDASRSWGDTHTGTEFAPAHVYISVIVYLGVPS